MNHRRTDHPVRKGLIFLITLSLPCQMAAQSFPDPLLEQIIEEIFLLQESFGEIPELEEDLYWFSVHPLNINNTSKEELSRLHFLTPFQIEVLLKYAEQFGPVGSIYELAYLPGFDSQLAGWLLPFVYFGKKESPLARTVPQVFSKIRQSVMIRYQEVAGRRPVYREYRTDSLSSNSAPLGDPSKQLIRYSLAAGDFLHIRWTAEKDPGEPFFTEKNKIPFDHHAFNMQIHPGTIIRQINLGDFHLMTGQGLVAWTGFSLGKTAGNFSGRKIPAGIRAFSSTEENRFFRGAALTAGKGPFTLSCLFSGHRVDARMTDEGFSNWITDGIHATERQMEFRKSLREWAAGGTIRYRGKSFDLGWNLLALNWNHEKVIRQEPAYIYDLSGRYACNISVDYQWSLQNMVFFGETAFDLNVSTAFLHGTEWQLSENIRLTMIFRHYSPDYQAPYGNGFSEGATVSNETGLYAAFRYQTPSGWEVNISHDVFRFPWLRYLVDSPSAGQEYSVWLSRTLNPSTKCTFRIRHKNKDRNYSANDRNLSIPVKHNKTGSRFQIHHQPSARISLTTRVETSRSWIQGESPRHGFFVSQDIGIHPVEKSWYAWIRFALFDTDDYDSRIYSYEHDVWTSMSFPAFSGKGTRFYLVMKTSVWNNLDTWIKWSVTDYNDREYIGTGWNAINSHTKHEVKCQVRWRF
ncbi:MAG: helix-hairpin-helix domain-containing protein [Bacteroidales bacterium]